THSSRAAGRWSGSRTPRTARRTGRGDRASGPRRLQRRAPRAKPKGSQRQHSGPRGRKVPRPPALGGPRARKVPRPPALGGPRGRKVPRPPALGAPSVVHALALRCPTSVEGDLWAGVRPEGQIDAGGGSTMADLRTVKAPTAGAETDVRREISQQSRRL